MNSLWILVVEDETDLAEGLGEILAIRGYNVEVAVTGKEAIDLCRGRAFDLALIDAKLPDINGLDALLEINRINPAIRTIIMTGYRIDQLLVYATGDESAVTVLPSPVAMEEVRERLNHGGNAALIIVLEERPEFGTDLAGFLKQQGSEALLTSPSGDSIPVILNHKHDVLILNLKDTPFPEAIKLYITLKQRGSIRPTVIIANYPPREAGTTSGLHNTPVSGCLFKPFKIQELVEDLQNIK